jgi:4-hydroxy-tetrahydrodipicolinate reductase
MLEISHQSFSRKAFASGAIRAVKFVYRKTGYFEMSDVLNLSNILENYIKHDTSRQARRNAYMNELHNDQAEIVSN